MPIFISRGRFTSEAVKGEFEYRIKSARCSPLVPIKNKIKLTGAEHEKLLCWHWFVVRGRGRRIQEEIKITPNFT